jgi:hypothetical protein
MNLTQQINYDAAIKRWCMRVDEYNNTRPTATIKRTITLPTGQKIVKESERKQGVLKASVKSTGMYLISEYRAVWDSTNRVLHGMAKPSEVCLRTNRVEIGEAMSRSPRSVYDHIQKLIEIGLVDKYEFCGRQHSFKLWISPKILFGEATATKPEIALTAPKTVVSPSVRQNLPLSYTSQKQPSTTIRAVECGKTLKQDHGNNEDPRSRLVNGKEPAYSMPSTETGGSGGRGGGGGPELSQSVAVAKWRRLPAYFKTLSINFWLLARTNLYPGRQFSDQENNEALIAITEGLFGGFAVNQHDRDWDGYYNELVQRVQMASEWFSKNTQRNPDLPWQSGKKMGYFDPNNNFGFAKTAAWLEKDQLRKKQNRVEYLLNQARVDFEKLAAGNPRPKIQHFTELQLFVYYQGLAKSYGKAVEERFCDQYLRQKAVNFTPAKRQTITIRAQKAANKKAQVVHVEPWMEMGESYYSEL